MVKMDYSETKNVFVFEDDGEVRWLYFNPDAVSGAQFVENCCYPWLIKRLVKENLDVEGFFCGLEDGCKQYLYDWDTDEEQYNAYGDWFEDSPDRELNAELMMEIIGNIKECS